MLRPLRVSCAGGHIPLDNDDHGGMSDDDDEERAGETDDEDGKGGKTKKRKVQKYSEFAYKSKLETLIGELERIRDEEPDSKSLVFSQYKSTLEWLQKELPNHGFQFRTLQSNMTMKKRAKALEDFQNDPPTTIFLLSMRSSNCGINLTHANRVFLMEPVLNPATEKQAIGRVMRLGQKRKVEIVRLVMENSIEVRIGKMLEKKYGKKKADEDDESSNNESGFAGSLVTDKCEMVTREFDLLFGVATEEGPTFEAHGNNSDGSDNDDGDKKKKAEVKPEGKKPLPKQKNAWDSSSDESDDEFLPSGLI